MTYLIPDTLVSLKSINTSKIFTEKQVFWRYYKIVYNHVLQGLTTDKDPI